MTGKELKRVYLAWGTVIIFFSIMSIITLSYPGSVYLISLMAGTIFITSLVMHIGRKKHNPKEIKYNNGNLYCKTFSGEKITIPLNNIGPHVRIENEEDEFWGIKDHYDFWYVTKNQSKHRIRLPLDVGDWIIELKEKYQEGLDHQIGRDVGADSSIGDIIHMRTILGKLVMLGFISVLIVLALWIMEILGIVDLV